MATGRLTPGEDPMYRREMSEAEALAAKATTDLLADSKEKPVIVESDGTRAGYKIEITFGPNRSSLREYGALVSLWESGKHFHGGGDSLMYFCFDCERLDPKSSWKQLIATLNKKTAPDRGCGGAVPGAAMSGGMGFCPNCQKAINTERLTNPFPFWGTTPELAAFIGRYFQALKSNADIYCKYHPTDIRYQSMGTGKGLDTARRLRGMFIYPLKNILKDTAAGASLDLRLKAFFNA